MVIALAGALLAPAAITAALAMPHDRAEARGCKPRVQGSVSFTCPPSSRVACNAQRDARRRAVADWERNATGAYGPGFGSWGSVYLPTTRIEGGDGTWTYTVSAYPCPTR